MLIQKTDGPTKYAYPGKLWEKWNKLETLNLVPHTTRPMRPGEVHGKEYYFIDFGELHYAYIDVALLFPRS